ncbi:MAG: hypothetical protein WC562_03590 [Dehalococcoidia bacterium]|jgi:hypothetical protein
METETKNFDYDSFTQDATGSSKQDYKIISFPFEKYEIKVKVSPSNEFIEITEVTVNKDFLSHKQRLNIRQSIDVDKYYRE